jgi:23S rRNA pseudouridine2605 synthase
VDGEAAHIGMKIDPAAATVAIDGVPLPLNPDLVRYQLYKPPGVITSTDDPHGRPVVTDLVPASPRVYPVGRLDFDSEGLLIVTNDGTLTNLLTHPRYGVEKTYLARVAGVPDRPAIERLVAGVTLEDGPAAAKRARLVDRLRDEALVEVVMTEGRKREVRRLFDAVGHPVARLVRTAIGPITDRGLAPGKWRALAADEIRALYSSAGAAWEDAGPSQDEAT